MDSTVLEYAVPNKLRRVSPTTMWKFIHKFGPEHSDLPTMIWNVNFLLRKLTLNIDYRCKKPIPLAIYISTVLCTLCYYYIYVFSMVWLVFVRCVDTGDMVTAMVAGSLGVSSQISTFNLFYMIVRASRVRFLVKECLEFDALTVPNTRFSINLNRYLRMVKMRAILYWLGIAVIAVVYIQIPWYRPGNHLPEDLFVIYGLEPRFETPYYEISYATMTCAVLFITYTACSVNVFIIVYVGYVEAQMVALSTELLHIWEDSITTASEFKIEHLVFLKHKRIIFAADVKAKINLDVKRRLVRIASSHSRNVTLLREMDEFYNVPNAIAFLCLGVSLIAELLGGLENTYLQVPFTFIQVAMNCYIGQRVMDAGEVFERAVYACKWENFDVTNIKLVLVMLQNSQRSMQISAGGMAVMSFTCLQSIIRTVYSTYTTLRSML